MRWSRRPMPGTLAVRIGLMQCGVNLYASLRRRNQAHLNGILFDAKPQQFDLPGTRDDIPAHDSYLMRP